MNVGFIAVAVAIALPAIASAISQGWATSSAVNAMARQPEAASEIRSGLLIALAFMEALTLFSWLIALLLTFRL
ncbi:MAG: ATP synthase F0 subunit C [Kiritimatiellia bacterium]